MIEIKCTEEQREILLNSSAVLDAFCDVMPQDKCDRATSCRECPRENIMWTIRGNEDAE